MTEVILEGLGVALITPFKTDCSIDYECLETLIEDVISGGCDYIVALGTTAETPTLSLEEKKSLASFIKGKVRERVPLILGIGGNNTTAVIKDIQSRDLTGYAAILSVTPFYNKPSQEGLYRHFKALADASPLPLILYNVPGRTGVNLSAKTTALLANNDKKICGVKEASGNSEQCRKIISQAHQSFSLVSGNDGDTVELMKVGAKGVISVLANAFPSQMKKLVALAKDGNFEEAQKYQESLQPLIKLIFEEGNPSGIKAVLGKMGKIKNILRLPLVPVSQTIEEKLDQEILKILQQETII